MPKRSTKYPRTIGKTDALIFGYRAWRHSLPSTRKLINLRIRPARTPFG